MWKEKVNIEHVFTLQPARPITYFGVGAIEKMSDIAKELKKRNVNKIMLCCGRASYKTTGAWDKVRPILEENKIEYVLYDKVRPNPTYEICDEAAKIAREEGVDAIMGIGGGSPLDTAKTVAVLLKNPDKTARELYEKVVVVDELEAAPIICINLTHGTGTEVNRFAIAQSDKGFKPGILGRSIYPAFTIEDPNLTKTLPESQSIYTSLDALNHAFEATTTTVRNPYCTELGLSAARLVYRWLPVVRREPENLTARYWLMYANALAGISFDIALLHLTHALEHPLSALNPKTAHGNGLAALLPSVVKVTYPALPGVCADFFSPIIPRLKGDPSEAQHAAEEVEKWLAFVGSPEKLEGLGFGKDDVDALTRNAMESPLSKPLFGVSPVKVTEELIRSIYEESLTPIAKR